MVEQRIVRVCGEKHPELCQESFFIIILYC